MSQPRRKRRRRRKPRREGSISGQTAGESAPQAQRGDPADAGRSRRRRRGAATSGGRPAKQVSSEDLVRKAHAPRPKTLTAPPDGQKLEEIIRELQSVWGVPQYPQEYRLTLKVADDRDARWARRTANGGGKPQTGAVAAGPVPTPEDGPKRERAPAAPRIEAGATDGADASGGAPARRKRSRRRRRGRKNP
ncbi:MAG: hypothetical protein M3333_07860 [Actinomycetota bacterium]|nr:hypothetical protein [Actinomycetota bacterium]